MDDIYVVQNITGVRQHCFLDDVESFKAIEPAGKFGLLIATTMMLLSLMYLVIPSRLLDSPLQ